MALLELLADMVLTFARAARRTQDRYDHLPVTGTVVPVQGRWSQRGWRALVAIGRVEWWLFVGLLAVSLAIGIRLLP